jgi:hypothetical protein
MEKTSCIHHEPLTKLDEDGSASILNYNLPTSTTYQVVSLVRLGIDRKRFKDSELKAPADNYWDRFDRVRTKEELTPQRVAGILSGEAYTSLTEVMDTGLNFTAEELPTATGVKFKAANLTVSTKSTSFATQYTANKIAEGFRPQLVRRASGKQQLVFQKRPARARPSIYMVMKMRMASYLGDYGAGQTLSTFSLLPGEKSVIEIRDYRHNETTRSSSQSVLDSYSESAMDDLQTTIETSTSMNAEASETDVDTMAASTSAEGGVNMLIWDAGGEASASASSVNTTSQSLTQQVDTLNNAVSHHVQTADTQRQVEINTDVTSTAVSETEQTTTRTLENINKSRVLNFVFRQLLQEYFTITYLDEVTFVYSNGYDTSRRTGTLGSLDNFLQSVLADKEQVAAVRSMIYVELCNLTDYTGTKVSFIEQVTEQHANCIERTGEKKVSYVRKRRDLKQTYKDKTVNGIILNVTHRVLRTPAVIVDALLGQGESLDCYNQHLQEAAYDGAHLANRKLEQAMAVIDAIEDPAEKARLYNHVFGTCCPTPQAAEEEA